MCVDIAKPYPEQPMPFDQFAYLLIFRHASAGQVVEESQDDRAILQTSHGDFADNERVAQDIPRHERRA